MVVAGSSPARLTKIKNPEVKLGIFYFAKVFGLPIKFLCDIYYSMMVIRIIARAGLVVFFCSAVLIIPTVSESQDIAVTAIRKLNLTEAVKTALMNNPNIDSMLKTIEKSEYLSRAASKEWLPTVTLDYSFTALPVIPEIELQGVEDVNGVDKFPLTDNTSFVFGVHVKMPLYTAGVVKYRKDMAKLGVDVEKTRFLETKADFVQEVTINYLNVLRLQNYSKVVTENLRRFIEHEDNTSAYFDAGLLPKNALLEVRAKRANADQEMIEAEKDLKISRAVLNITMGIDIDSEFMLEEIADQKEIAYSIEECFGLAREKNPSLVVFTYLKKIAEIAVSLEKTELWPKVSGEISYFKHGKTPELKGDDYLTNDITMGVVKADWKIFDWFKTTDLVNAKKKEIDILVDRLKGVQDKVSLDIREAHLAMKAGKNKLKVAERGIEHAEENYRITKLRYDEKIAKPTEVNDALVLLRQSQFNYYNAFYEYSVAVAKLERVIGINIEIYEK